MIKCVSVGLWAFWHKMCVWKEYSMTNDLQKAGLSKRIAAFMLDGILLVILVTGVMSVLAWAFQYQSYVDTFYDGYDQYQKDYGVEFGITQEDYDKFTPEQKENFDKATEALNKDEKFVHAYNMMINLLLLIITLSVFAAYFLLEFLVPLKLGNGQTLGKKIFGIALMRVDSVKISSVLLFVRAILGKYTIGTMVPVMIIMMILVGQLGLLGTIILGLILLLQVIMMIVTRTNSAIHDLLANTVVVDMASQMIFGSELELITYKEQRQAEKAARQSY